MSETLVGTQRFTDILGPDLPPSEARGLGAVAACFKAQYRGEIIFVDDEDLRATAEIYKVMADKLLKGKE